VLALAEEEGRLACEKWRRLGPQPLPFDPKGLAGLPVDARGPGSARPGSGTEWPFKPGVLAQANLQADVEALVGRGWSVTTLAQLAERSCNGIPPQGWFPVAAVRCSDSKPAASALSTSLKRYADVWISLLVAAVQRPPLLVVAALLIKLGMGADPLSPVPQRLPRTALHGDQNCAR